MSDPSSTPFFPFPSGSPRLAGIQEHRDRLELLLHLAGESNDPTSSFRLQITACYSARAVTELMLEAAEKQEVASLSVPSGRASRKEIEAEFAQRVPFYDLIERIRIHDFHRFGVIAPNTTTHRVFLGGPVKLGAQKGAAAISLQPAGPRIHKSGAAFVNQQRPLTIRDGDFFDEISNQYVSLPSLLHEYCDKIDGIVTWFAGLIRPDSAADNGRCD